MKNDPYRLRQKWFVHVLFLVLLPPFVHACAAVLFGLEAEGSAQMLFSVVLAAVSTGIFLRKARYGWLAAALSGAWPGVLGASRHWYWTLDMPSPGGSAQSLVRLLGWTDVSAAAAVAVLLLPCGAAGWLFARYNPE